MRYPILTLPLALLGLAVAPACAQDATVVGQATVIPGTGPGTRTDGVTGGRIMQAANAEDAAKRQNLKPAAFLTSKLIGIEVHNPAGANVGKIEDFLIADGGTVKAVVVHLSGFVDVMGVIGVGDKRIAVEPSALVLRPGGDRFSAVLNMGKDTLTATQAFNPAEAIAAQ